MVSRTTLLIFLVTIGCALGQGQSKCDSICANDASCSSGKCILTQCSDSNACFKYCLNCAGVETCYASGQACERAYNVVMLGSSSIKSSHLLVALALLASTSLFRLMFAK